MPYVSPFNTFQRTLYVRLGIKQTAINSYCSDIYLSNREMRRSFERYDTGIMNQVIATNTR